MKRYYVEKSSVHNLIERITAAQQKANIFCNVAVKPYKGKKQIPLLSLSDKGENDDL